MLFEAIYSVKQTIFHTLPWLFVIPDDEWISPKQMEQVVDLKSSFIPVFNSRENLRSDKPGTWRFKNPGIVQGDKILILAFKINLSFTLTRNICKHISWITSFFVGKTKKN